MYVHFVSRDWRKTGTILHPAKGGLPPGSVRFQQPCAWAAKMERAFEAAVIPFSGPHSIENLIFP
jgi:hypothetical protein